MNRKKSLAAVLLLCTVFGFTACGTKEQTKNGVTTKKVDKQAATDISNVHLRDKKSLYDKDHTKVTTMYLTVRRGDATEIKITHGLRSTNIPLKIIRKCMLNDIK